MKIKWTYGYSPYRSQSGNEIPAYEVLDHKGNTILETNKNLPLEQQENIARLASLAPELAAAAQKVIRSWDIEYLAAAVCELSIFLDERVAGDE